VEFAAGVLDEVSFNRTNVAAVNAAEIPADLNLSSFSKERIITTTSVAVGSKILKSSAFQ